MDIKVLKSLVIINLIITLFSVISKRLFYIRYYTYSLRYETANPCSSSKMHWQFRQFSFRRSLESDLVSYIGVMMPVNGCRLTGVQCLLMGSVWFRKPGVESPAARPAKRPLCISMRRLYNFLHILVGNRRNERHRCAE